MYRGAPNFLKLLRMARWLGSGKALGDAPYEYRSMQRRGCQWLLNCIILDRFFEPFRGYFQRTSPANAVRGVDSDFFSCAKVFPAIAEVEKWIRGDAESTLVFKGVSPDYRPRVYASFGLKAWGVMKIPLDIKSRAAHSLPAPVSAFPRGFSPAARRKYK